jgi:hypothetical protein
MNQAQDVLSLCPKVRGNTRYEDLRADMVALRHALCSVLIRGIHLALDVSDIPMALNFAREFDAEVQKLIEEVLGG